MTLTPIRMTAEGDPKTGLIPSHLVAETDFLTDDKTELIHEFFSAQDSGVTAGVWECAPAREVFDSHPVDEMVTLISGSVTMTSHDGTQQVFSPGETFFIAKGTRCVWENTETVLKFYMAVES